jgi:hypothetical protein
VEGSSYSNGSSCSKRSFSKAAAEQRGEAYLVPYVEPLRDARTQLTTFFNSLHQVLAFPLSRCLCCQSNQACPSSCARM